MVAEASWLSGGIHISIVAVAVASLLGWPFAAFAGLPIALDALWRRGILFFVFWAITGALMCLVRLEESKLTAFKVPMITVDTTLYKSLVVAPLNIVKYNVFNGIL